MSDFDNVSTSTQSTDLSSLVKDCFKTLSIDETDVILISSLVRIRMDKGVSTIAPSHLRFLKRLKEKTNKPILLVSFGSPYIDAYDYFDAYVATYGYGPISVKAAANAIFGREDISGKLPIDLNDIYKKGVGLNRSKRVSEFKKKDNNKYNLESAFAVIDSAINNQIFPGAQISFFEILQYSV